MKTQKLFTLLATTALLVPTFSNGVNALEEVSHAEDLIATLPTPSEVPIMPKTRTTFPNWDGTYGSCAYAFDNVQGLFMMWGHNNAPGFPNEFSEPGKFPLLSGAVSKSLVKSVVFSLTDFEFPLMSLNPWYGGTMQSFFGNCTALESIDFTGLDLSEATNMSYLFENDTALTSIDFANHNIANITNLSNMFSGCTSLASLSLSNFDTAKVGDLSGMFANCISLTNLNIANFDTSNATDKDNMFSGCTSLRSLTLGTNTIIDGTNIPEIDTTSGKYSGRWVNLATGKSYKSSADFMANYDGSSPGTYEWAESKEPSIEANDIAPKIQKGASYQWKIDDHAPAYYNEYGEKTETPFYAKLNGKIYDQNDTVTLAEGTYEVEITNERPSSRAVAVTTTAKITITSTDPTPDAGGNTNNDQKELENKILDITKDYNLSDEAQNNIAKELEEKAKNGTLSLDDIKQIIQKYAPNLSASEQEELAGKLYKLLYPNSPLLPKTSEVKQTAFTFIGFALLSTTVLWIIKRKREN